MRRVLGHVQFALLIIVSGYECITLTTGVAPPITRLVRPHRTKRSVRLGVFAVAMWFINHLLNEDDQ